MRVFKIYREKQGRKTENGVYGKNYLLFTIESVLLVKILKECADYSSNVISKYLKKR